MLQKLFLLRNKLQCEHYERVTWRECSWLITHIWQNRCKQVSLPNTLNDTDIGNLEQSRTLN